MIHPIDILERYWNFTSFKPLQEEIITAVLNGKDCLALLPTGGGKSMCFQIPALAKEGICIVISPLIALMKDQVNSLQQKGIKAMALTSEYSYNDINIMLDNCIYGQYKFLYLSPERLQQDIVQDRIRQMAVNLIAVDEAHCISQWGNDFRPAYKNILKLRELQPSVNVLALTASATPKVVSDIQTELDFIDSKIFKQSFLRPNLAYMVFEVDDKYYKIEQILQKNTSASIIYVRNRKSTVEISQHLELKGFTSTFYHGGLSVKQKDDHFKDWMTNKKQVMVATNAFGMGIDKPDVKTVIHVNLPESLESYFQEAGRAGRNNEKAYAVVLKHKGDETHVKHQFLSILPSIDFIKVVYRKLCNYFQISYGEGEFSTHDFNFNAFCKAYKFNTLLTYNALQTLDRTSIINLTQQYKRRSNVQFLVSNDTIFRYLERHQHMSTIIKSLLRTYGGIFEQDVKINTILMADKANTNEDVVISVLKQLFQDDIISLDLKQNDAEVTFLQPREDDKTINRIAKIIEQQQALKKNQVKSVLDYVNTNEICKSQQLLSYFGETDSPVCGICSVCISNKTNTRPKTPKDDIALISLLLAKHDLSSRTLLEQSSLNELELKNTLKLMLEQHLIKVTDHNTYTLI
ncbi:MAG: RecQ family ATP-dependent DNA helicase [Flavobacteriaceae bacterium]|nr:RecQ family ATP-dependent DNA helicase [Flavobacteriaceae bacterium]